VIAVALVAPVIVVRGDHLARALLVAFAPALLVGIVAAISLPTGWGHAASDPRNSDLTNSGSLIYGAVILLVAGVLGFTTAAIARLVRRGGAKTRSSREDQDMTTRAGNRRDPRAIGFGHG
jgi:hypothetical protein